MAKVCQHILYFILFIYLVIDLGLDYHTYKKCSMPIHHWYMAILSFALIHRVSIILYDMATHGTFTSKALSLIRGPLAIVSVFVWNVVGTFFLVSIAESPSPEKCLPKSTLILNLMLNGLIYWVYVVFLILFWVYLKLKQRSEKKKVKLEAELNTLYDRILRPIGSLSQTDIFEVIQTIRSIKHKNNRTLIKMPISKKEESVLSVFYKSDFVDSRVSFLNAREAKEHYCFHLSERNSSALDGIKEPLLGMFDDKKYQEHLEKQITENMSNDFGDSNNCIICFLQVEDKSSTLTLKCRHTFHKTCIIGWLRIKPTCPICRRNFRIDFMNFIENYLDQKLIKKGVNVEKC